MSCHDRLYRGADPRTIASPRTTKAATTSTFPGAMVSPEFFLRSRAVPGKSKTTSTIKGKSLPATAEGHSVGSNTGPYFQASETNQAAKADRSPHTGREIHRAQRLRRRNPKPRGMSNKMGIVGTTSPMITWAETASIVRDAHKAETTAVIAQIARP